MACQGIFLRLFFPFNGLSFVLGNPVAESAAYVQAGKGVDAFSTSAVLYGKLEVCSPGGIVLLVKRDYAAVRKNDRVWRCFQTDPGILLYYLVFAKEGPVDHDGELVAVAAFIHAGLEKEVVVTVVDEGNFHIPLMQLDFPILGTLDTVFEISATLDFPAVVNLAAGLQKETGGEECHGG